GGCSKACRDGNEALHLDGGCEAVDRRQGSRRRQARRRRLHRCCRYCYCRCPRRSCERRHHSHRCCGEIGGGGLYSDGDSSGWRAERNDGGDCTWVHSDGCWDRDGGGAGGAGRRLGHRGDAGAAAAAATRATATNAASPADPSPASAAAGS
ncbi:unnamed protein product, partial [Ectocarpus sp. 12 AP-2014]